MSGCYTIVRHHPSEEVFLIPVENLFDAQGNEVLDLAKASTFVAPLPDGNWLSADIADFDVYRLH